MPPKTEPPAVAAPEPAPPKKGRGKLALILGLPLGAALFGGLGFGAGWFVYSESNSPMSQALRMIDRNTENLPAQARGGLMDMFRSEPESTTPVTTYFTFDEPLTTNPLGSRRFVQVGVTLSTQQNASIMELVRRHQAAIRSDLLTALNGFTEEEMTGRDGREALAAQLRDLVNERLQTLEGESGIDGVFFPSFVLQ
jgi:flagellar FliL protein